MKNKILFSMVVLLYILIPSLILFNDTLFQYKFYILTIMGILIYIVFMINKTKNNDLGITTNNLFKSLKRNIPLISLFVITIIVFKIFGLSKYNPTESIYFYIFYIFISCPIQEFLYRGVFGYFEKTFIENKYIIILISSVLYSYVHIIYRDITTCVLTFVFGIILYILYRKDYNLFGVSINHIILGILTICLGIIN